LFEGLDIVTKTESDYARDEEARAAFTLQELGYRFTGADGYTLALALNKAEAKAALQRSGVLTPPWRVFAHPDEVCANNLGSLTFPVIVKPVAEDSSLGIDANAVVSDLPSLRARVAYLIERYCQHVLVESFIDGREFNISIWDSPPQVLPLAEVDLSALGSPEKRIVSFAAKWEEASFEYTHTPVICPAVVSEELAECIRDTALRAWEAVGGQRGYGRVDMRVREKEVYVLEVNPNPSLAPDAGFARAALAAGFDYAHMILKILSFVVEDAFVNNPSD
ncbi:MAG: ATP-grasp domain-containing protein, partial [Candidatus Hadarchaeum sp.]